jgi:hypothetical protein
LAKEKLTNKATIEQRSKRGKRGRQVHDHSSGRENKYKDPEAGDASEPEI